MKIPLGIARKLLELKQGIKIPYSKLKHPLTETMIENGIISRQVTGRSKTIIYLLNPESLTAYLFNHYGIKDLEEYIIYLEKEESTRAESVDVTSDSKSRAIRTFKGFLVSSYEPITCTYKGSDFLVNPIDGTFIFIYDYQQFIPDKNVTIVGIENPEVFRNIEKYGKIFNQTNLLFVCRYPQTKDLARWLKKIPNNYLHFGDLDFAGINIYLNEYKKHLNERATFFIPEGTELLIESKGNRHNYQQQTLLPFSSDYSEPGLTKLIAWISKYKKGLEQEIFVL